MALSIPDLVITMAYFSIPIQILVALCKFPRLTRRATKRVVILLILFALFIFLCGAGHLIRCLGQMDTAMFRVVNMLTAVVSLLTSVYLLPFIPHLLEGSDKLYLEATASKKIIESMYPPIIRERLLKRDGAIEDKEADGDEKAEEQKKEKKAMQRRPSFGLFDRMSRSESVAVRRIHDFVQRKRMSTSLTLGANGQATEPEPIAEEFQHTSIMFADISNFTLWSSNHSPIEVFTLLESLFYEFDCIANRMKVFKLSTVGDCYIAATGVPYPMEEEDDHAIVLCQFAECCRRKANEVMERLSKQRGMDGVDRLNVRIGIHSGPVTAGVLRGNKARFDLFGDTINTAARIESTGKPDRIQLSRETAELLEQSGKGEWLVPRKEIVSAKGKGDLKTFWLQVKETEAHSNVTNALAVDHQESDMLDRKIPTEWLEAKETSVRMNTQARVHQNRIALDTKIPEPCAIPNSGPGSSKLELSDIV